MLVMKSFSDKSPVHQSKILAGIIDPLVYLSIYTIYRIVFAVLCSSCTSEPANNFQFIYVFHPRI